MFNSEKTEQLDEIDRFEFEVLRKGVRPTLRDAEAIIAEEDEEIVDSPAPGAAIAEYGTTLSPQASASSGQAPTATVQGRR